MMIHARLTAWPLVVPLTLALAGGLSGCSGGKNEYVAPPPPEVTVASPVATSITPFLEQVGRTEAVEEAELRARVRGFLQSIEFQPGQKVEAGQVLYNIESDQYQAEVNSAQAAVDAAVAAISVAEAMVDVAQAEVAKTQQDLARERSLDEQGAGSKSQLDAAVAAADAAVASKKSAEANIEAAEAEKGRAEAALAQAKLDLGYTQVRAPISGRITKTNYKVGNLVENGSHLATIVDDDRVFANFSVSDRELLRFMKARQAAVEAGVDVDERQWRDSPAYLARETDEGFPFEGGLDYVDQAGIQSSTGTLGLRAVFDNHDGDLVPGLFVTVRVPVADETFESLVIPESAVMRDQEGTYVLTVSGDNKVEKTRIDVPMAVSGWAIVSTGLDEQTRVIVAGQQRAREGLEVTVADQKPLDVDGTVLMRGTSEPRPAKDDQDAADGSGSTDGAAASPETEDTEDAADP